MANMASRKANTLSKAYPVLLWRLLAVAVCTVWTAMFLLRFFIFHLDANRHEFFTVPVYMALYALPILASVYLIVSPLRLWIYVFLCLLWGLVHLLEGRGILGLFEYLLGCMFAFHLGFFRTRVKIKISAVLLVLLIAITIQIKCWFLRWEAILLWYLEFLLTVGIAFVVFLPEIRKIQSERKEAILRLSSAQFTEQDVQILQKVLANEKYEAIQKDCGLAPATFNRRIHRLYAQIGIGDRISFLSRYSGYTMVLVGTETGDSGEA